MTALEPIYAAIGKRIELARVNARLTQAELGAHPLTRACIGNIEQVRQRLLAHTLIEIAEVVGVHPRDLLPGAAPPRDQSAGDDDLVAELRAQGIAPDVAERIAVAVCSPESS